MAVADQIEGAESGGDRFAKNPNSSAEGRGQFIDGTWLAMLAKHRPDIAGTRDELLALKTDPGLSREMTAAYASDNAGILSKNGLPVTAGTTYLAHFAGPNGAVGLLNADPATPAVSVLGQAAVAANPFLARMSAGDVAAWANRKMGGQGAAPLSMGGPAPAAPVATQPEPAKPAAPQQPAPEASLAPDMAALTALPQLQNLITLRPRPVPGRFAMPTAPFSLRG